MRREWSEVADEMTRRTPEDDERALRRAAVGLGPLGRYDGAARCRLVLEAAGVRP